jgi:hypothetical protein
MNYQGPIICETHNSVWNAENQLPKTLFRQPCGDQQNIGTFGSEVGVWTKLLESDDYTLKALVGPDTFLECEAHFVDDRCHGMAIGIDTLAPHPKCNNTMAYASADSTPSYDRFLATYLPGGEHIFYMLYTSVNAPGMQYRGFMPTSYGLNAVSSLRIKYMG